MKNKSYLYCITSPTGKQYIGKSNSPRDRWHDHVQGSECNGTSAIHAAIKKYGKQNMIFEIIASCFSEQDAYAAEAELIAERNTLAPNGYNLNSGGLGGFRVSDELRATLRSTWTEERRTRESLRVSGANNPMFGRKADDALRARLSAAQKGLKRTLAQCENISNALKGKPKSQSHRLHLSLAKKGKPVVQKTLSRAIQANTGHPLSQEHRKKIGDAQRGELNHCFGKPMPDEQRKKISESQVGRRHSLATKLKMSMSRSEYWQRRREQQ